MGLYDLLDSVEMPYASYLICLDMATNLAKKLLVLTILSSESAVDKR